MDFRLLFPAPGRRVLDPSTGKPLPEEGAVKPLNTYWNRRLADGDVILPATRKIIEAAGKKKNSSAQEETSVKGSK